MAMICVADGACTTWSTTIPASMAQGPSLPFSVVSAESQETCYDVSTITRLIFVTVDDLGGGIYNILIEDPFQSGLISSPQGAPNNTEGALPDCLDGSDPSRLFVWDITIADSSARNFVWFQSQSSFVSSGVSGTYGAFYSIQINTNLPFPPSQYPYLTASILQGWVTEFGDAVQVGLNPLPLPPPSTDTSTHHITLGKACCQSAEGTTIQINSTGATTWDVTVGDPLQTNLVSDPEGDSNNTAGSLLDCFGNGDPDAILTMSFTVLGAAYTLSIPTSMVTGLATSNSLNGADLVISLDTDLIFTTAELANTLQADLNAVDGLDGYLTVTSLRCDGVKAAEQITGAGTLDDPLVPNVVLHPDGSIVCGPNGLALADQFNIAPQGPTSTPTSGIATPPDINGCANWICELPNGDWYAPEHDVFLGRVEDVAIGGAGIAVGPGPFVVGAPNNHILNFTLTNTFDRPIVPRIIIRAQSRLISPASVGSAQFISALVNESWSGNLYQQDILAATNTHGDAIVEDEKSTTFVVMTTGGLYAPNFGGYAAIPAGGTVTYDFNVGHTSAGAVNWTRSVLVIEAALFTTT